MKTLREQSHAENARKREQDVFLLTETRLRSG